MTNPKRTFKWKPWDVVWLLGTACTITAAFLAAYDDPKKIVGVVGVLILYVVTAWHRA